MKVYITCILCLSIFIISPNAISQNPDNYKVLSKTKRGKDVFFKTGDKVSLMIKTGQHYNGRLIILSKEKVFLGIDTIKTEEIQYISGKMLGKSLKIWFSVLGGAVVAPGALLVFTNLPPIAEVALASIMTIGALIVLPPGMFLIPFVAGRDRKFIEIVDL